MRINRLLCAGVAAFIFISFGSGTAQAAGTLDQSNSAPYASTSSLLGAQDGNGQTFTAGISGLLTNVDVYVSQFSVNADLNVSIYAVSAGLPTGSALASTTIAASSIPSAGRLVGAAFTTPTRVEAGTQYAITLTSTLTAGFYNMGFSSGGYTGGGAIVISQLSRPNFISPPGNNDLIFNTYVEVASSGDAPPPVMQQFGMPSVGTCEAAAPIVLNWGGAGSGGWGNSWAQWVNSGRGGAVCTRTLVYSNAVSHWIVG